MAKDILALSLRDIAPSSITDDPQIQAMIAAIDPELQSVSSDTREALIYSRIDELSEPVVDMLAWQLHVDFYEPMGIALETKRELVKSSILIHMRKGTRWAVQEICNIAFGDTTVLPWFEYGGEPYHFRVETEGRLYDDATWRRFLYALAVTKSVRDWLDSIDISRPIDMPVYIGAALYTKESFGIPLDISNHEYEGTLHVGGAALTAGEIFLRPRLLDIRPSDMLVGMGAVMAAFVQIGELNPVFELSWRGGVKAGISVYVCFKERIDIDTPSGIAEARAGMCAAAASFITLRFEAPPGDEH